jgi:hypothetical protein
MFLNRGDGEWLYNIPDRPVLTGVAALFFWLGVGITAVYTLRPLWRKLTHWRQAQPASHTELASAFLLIWWLAGISPAFISVPPASLGHTILAQPAVFMLTAVPLWWLGRRMRSAQGRLAVTAVLGVILVGSIALRDWPAYFVEWPQRGMVRFLYRADLGELADYVNSHPGLTDFGVTSLLAGPWDQLALSSDLGEDTAARPRWFNPERAALLNPPLSFTGYPETAVAYPDYFEPTGVQVGGYTLSTSERESSAGFQPAGEQDARVTFTEEVCFENGLCLVTAVYHPEQQTLDLTWRAGGELRLPERALISNPPPPDVYAGPRLSVFAQLLDAEGNFLVGDDGLWVDVYALQPGDLFIQQHRFMIPADGGAKTAVFGLYDPMTGERILTEDGRDYLTADWVFRQE